MLDLSKLDLEEIAAALADQTDYEHRWLINPQTGEIVFWTAHPATPHAPEARSARIPPSPSSRWL